MNATEEWLRYIENRGLHDIYGVNGYEDLENPDDDNKKEEDTEV